MSKYLALLAGAFVLAMAAPGKPVATSGTWKVDARHSDAQLTTDGTTEFGKKNTNFTVGFARLMGIVKLDSTNPANSTVHIDFYPSTSMDPTIDHDGNVNIKWFSNEANNTMICFRSQTMEQTADGRLKATGDLGLMRVDRNVEITPSESYSGPVYGPPMFHHVKQTATFVFDLPAEAASGPNKGYLSSSGSTSMAREDFPQLFTAIFATEWPAVVRDKNCQTLGTGEAYGGTQCTGTFLLPTFPVGPRASYGEDYPGPQNFNSIVGQHLTIAVHMRLKPSGSGAKAAGEGE